MIHTGATREIDPDRDVLGLAREVTGTVGVEGTIQEVNGDVERIVHDPRLLQVLRQILEEVKGLRRDVAALKRR